MKTHQRGARRELRSKSAEMVAQEIYAHLLVYFAIRAVVNRAAYPRGIDPDQVSFIASRRVIRRRVANQAAFPRDQEFDRRGCARRVSSQSCRLLPVRTGHVHPTKEVNA